MKLLPTLMAGAAAGALLMTGSAEAATCGLPTGSVSCNVLNPGAYASLGAYTGSGGGGVIDTAALTFTTGSGIYHGVSVGGVAVFDFSSFTLGAGSTITVQGGAPLAILSTGGVTVGGVINLNGNSGAHYGPGGSGNGGGGAGGSFGGSGSGAGGTGGGAASGYGAGGGGGGTSGGYNLSINGFPPNTNAGYGAAGGTPSYYGTAGGAGGTPAGGQYAALTQLAGGAGGGSGGGYRNSAGYFNNEGQFIEGNSYGGYQGGGGGGGGLEVGGLGAFYLQSTGAIDANGGYGSGGGYGGAGGGGGGNVVFFGNSLNLNGYIGVNGGNGGQTLNKYGGGGGGGGGTITGLTVGSTTNVTYGPDVFLSAYGGCNGAPPGVTFGNSSCGSTDPVSYNLLGYASGGFGNYVSSPLTVSFDAPPAVPEPASMLMVGTGLAAAGLARRRRRRR